MSSSVFPTLDALPEDLLHVTATDLQTLATEFDYEPLGLPQLRAAIANHYTQLGLPTTPAEILVTTGAQQAIHLLFTLFARTTGTIITENPTYTGALDAARAAGANIIALPIDNEGIKTPPLRDTLSHSPVDLIYLMSTCQNPTGTIMSTTRRHEIAHLAKSFDIPIIDDTTLANTTFTAHHPLRNPRPRSHNHRLPKKTLLGRPTNRLDPSPSYPDWPASR